MNRYELEFTRIQLAQLSARFGDLASLAIASANVKQAGRFYDIRATIDEALIELDYISTDENTA